MAGAESIFKIAHGRVRSGNAVTESMGIKYQSVKSDVHVSVRSGEARRCNVMVGCDFPAVSQVM